MMNPKDNAKDYYENMKQVIMDSYDLTSEEYVYIVVIFHQLTSKGFGGSFYDLLDVVKILKPNLENLGVGIKRKEAKRDI